VLQALLSTSDDAVVVLTADPGIADADQGLVAPLHEAMTRAQGISPEARTATFVVIAGASPGHESPFTAACVEGVRGIAQSLALEWAGRTRVNVVIAPTQAAAEPTCAWLTDQRAGFVTGSTFDLRADAWRSL